MNLVSAPELAKLCDVHVQNIYVATRNGRIKAFITETGKKMYDPVTAKADFFNNRKDNLVPPKDRKPTPDDVADESDIPEDGLLTIKDAERLEKTYKGKLAKLKYEQELGLVVPIDEVAATVEQEYTLVRTRMRAISAKLASQVALEDDEKKCRKIIEEAIEDALKELSSYEQAKG